MTSLPPATPVHLAHPWHGAAATDAGGYSETGCYAYSSGAFPGMARYGYLGGGGEVQRELDHLRLGFGLLELRLALSGGDVQRELDHLG